MKTLSPPGYVKNSFASWSPLLLSSSNTEVRNIPPRSLFVPEGHCSGGEKSRLLCSHDCHPVAKHQTFKRREKKKEKSRCY